MAGHVLKGWVNSGYGCGGGTVGMYLRVGEQWVCT